MGQAMEGYLYLLQHPDKPGLVKIGRTTRSPQQRLSEHNECGFRGKIALESGKPWKLIHDVPVKDASKAEAYVWDYLCVPKFGKIELHGMPLDSIQVPRSPADLPGTTARLRERRRGLLFDRD